MDEFRISDMKRRQREAEPPAAPVGGAPPGMDAQPAADSPGSTPPAAAPDAPLPPRSAPPPVMQANESVNLRQYWEVIVRFRLVVAAVTVVVSIAAFTSTYLKLDKFSADVEILYKEDRYKRGFGQSGQQYYPETLAKIANSRLVLSDAETKVAAELEQLQAGGHSIPEADWEKARDAPGKGLPGSLEAKLDPESESIIHITAIATKSRFLAAALANAAAKAFIGRLTEIGQKEAGRKAGILERLLESKQKEIQVIEGKILELKREQGEKESSFTAIAADEERLLNLVSQYEMMYQENRLKLEELEQQVGAIKHELGIGGVSTDSVQWIDSSNIMERRLEELKVQKAELLTRYTEENSLVFRISSQIEAIEKIVAAPSAAAGGKKRVRVDSLRSKMVTNLIMLESQMQGISTKLESIRVMRGDLNRKLIELPVKTLKIERLKRQKEVLEKLADDIRSDYQKEKIASRGNVADIQIIQPAEPPGMPFYPNRKKSGMMGFVFGIMLGVVAAFLLEHWDNTFSSTTEIKNRLGMQTLGLIPLWEDEDKFINPAGIDDVNAEVYGVLRNNIRYSISETPEKCLLVASAIQSEGKSLTAANLASTFSFEGNRTLLIALDLRRRREYFGLRPEGRQPAHAKGIGDFLAGEADYSEIIYETIFENLYVLPTGEKRKNASRLLQPTRLKRLFRDMEKQFDVVIIDAPAVLPVVDTTVVAPFVRGILLVVQAGKTPIGACQQAVLRLQHVQGRIIGVVLNKAKNLNHDFFYGSGYSYSFKKRKSSSLYKV